MQRKVYSTQIVANTHCTVVSVLNTVVDVTCKKVIMSLQNKELISASASGDVIRVVSLLNRGANVQTEDQVYLHFINPRRACTARVKIFGYMSVCSLLYSHTTHASPWLMSDINSLSATST